ncbi:MAG: hypothetical protein ACD_62C00432G0002 [uncultured bacterium]|nr:MAG: hypothetical protein ACD_62C00432G0002 [uncultured bacterium]
MRNNPHGFTLIELVLVIALMGILGYTAIPAITSTQTFGLDNASRKLEADLRYAQNTAMTTGEPHGFRTITDGTTSDYEIYEVVSNQPINSPYDRLPMIEDFTESYKGISFKDDNSYDIRFDAQGNPTFIVGGQNIILRNPGNETKTISINNIGLIDVGNTVSPP